MSRIQSAIRLPAVVMLAIACAMAIYPTALFCVDRMRRAVVAATVWAVRQVLEPLRRVREAFKGLPGPQVQLLRARAFYRRFIALRRPLMLGRWVMCLQRSLSSRCSMHVAALPMSATSSAVTGRDRPTCSQNIVDASSSESEGWIVTTPVARFMVISARPAEPNDNVLVSGGAAWAAVTTSMARMVRRFMPCAPA